jgi:hypothetical protein
MTEVQTPQEPVREIIEEDVSEERPYYFQLDVLKAIAIVFVIMDHSLTWEIKGSMANLFWERLSIPFFLIVMGFNMGLSFKHRGTKSLRELYTVEYFKRKIVRYVFPFLALYMGAILVGLSIGYLEWNEYILLGFLPFWGPGNWFIPVLFSSIIVFPLIYWAFNKQPELTLVLCFLSEILMQLILYAYIPFPIGTWSAFDWFMSSVIRVNILFFLPAVGLGLWFSRGHEFSAKRNWFIYIYAPISIVFMVDFQTHLFSDLPGIIGQFFSEVDVFIRGDYTLLFYGYAALLFLIAMELVPRVASGQIQRGVQKIGKASYHILLFQIFWYSIVYFLTYLRMLTNTGVYEPYHHEIPLFHEIWGFPIWFYVFFYLFNLEISLIGGYLWYWAENRVNSVDKPWWKHLWIQRFASLFMAVFSILLMLFSLQLIGELTGLFEYGRTHDIFLLNRVTAPGFVLSFIAVVFFIGLCMFFIYRSFSISDDEFPL